MYYVRSQIRIGESITAVAQERTVILVIDDLSISVSLHRASAAITRLLICLKSIEFQSLGSLSKNQVDIWCLCSPLLIK